jgi:hypothetical protein
VCPPSDAPSNQFIRSPAQYAYHFVFVHAPELPITLYADDNKALSGFCTENTGEIDAGHRGSMQTTALSRRQCTAGNIDRRKSWYAAVRLSRSVAGHGQSLIRSDGMRNGLYFLLEHDHYRNTGVHPQLRRAMLLRVVR